MRWLCRLVTPPGGLILEPFLGSGSTAIAAHLEGFRCLGIEREAEYLAIASARLEHARRYPDAWADTTPGLDRDEARSQAEAGNERAALESQGQRGLF